MKKEAESKREEECFVFVFGCWVRVRVTTRCKGQVLICLLNACYYLFVFFNF